jgi:glycosyltransferase involved in cell wall biosynthesis
MGWILARLSGIPIWITSRRDLGFKRKKIYDTLFRFTAEDCKRCVANCQAVREQVIQRRNLPTQRVEVIYNGLEFSVYQKPSEHAPLRENLGVENGSPLIGMVANFNFKIKGHQYFLEAAKKVLEKMPNTEFLLVGDGPLRPQYEQMASELGVLRKVHFLGRRSDVPMIITNLDVSVLPSTSEGLSNVILESMAAGKPVIATNVGGNREIVQDGVTGYLVTPADSRALADRMLTLLQNPDRAKTFGLEGRKVVEEKFTVEAMVKKYEKLYMSLVEEHYR